MESLIARDPMKAMQAMGISPTKMVEDVISSTEWWDSPAWCLLESVAERHGVATMDARHGRKPEELRARREWIRLVQDSWGLSISETARLLGVDRCAVRGARTISAGEAQK